MLGNTGGLVELAPKLTPFIRKSIMAIDALAYFPPHSNLDYVSATFVLSSDFIESPDKVGPVEGRWRHPILAFPLIRGRPGWGGLRGKVALPSSLGAEALDLRVITRGL